MKKKPINESSWPEVEKMENIPTAPLNIVVHINGKKRAVISTNKDQNQNSLVELAKNHSQVKKLLTGKKIVKTIFIENKLINFVIENETN